MSRFALRSSFLAIVLLAANPYFSQSLRVVSWNTANDVGSAGTDTHTPTNNGPAASVLRAIGALNVSGSSRPLDVLALQESVYYTGTGINPTAQSFVNVLNNIYGAGTYAASTLNGTTTGQNAGNGPNTLVYRTSTVQIVSQNVLGTPSGSGVARQVMQYRLQPVGYGTSSSFYLFNSHYKSGTTTSDNDRRGVEAGLINAAVNGLPNNSAIVYAGDFNPTNNTNDLGYRGVVTNPGTNHAVDPLNPNNVFQNWSLSSFRAMATESPATSEAFPGQGTGGMHYRDDMLLNSPGILSGNTISYIDGSFVAFGNTGSHTYQEAITTGSAALLAADLVGYSTADAMQLLSQIAQACDHLPVVADYQLIAVPEPGGWLLVIAVVGFVKRRRA